MSQSLDRSNALVLSSFTERDRRWLVHLFAALQQGIQDALEYDSLPFHDASIVEDRDRCQRLWTSIHDELPRCMERTHAEEAVLASGLLALEGLSLPPT